jgi:hypothetical protein
MNPNKTNSEKTKPFIVGEIDITDLMDDECYYDDYSSESINEIELSAEKLKLIYLSFLFSIKRKKLI